MVVAPESEGSSACLRGAAAEHLSIFDVRRNRHRFGQPRTHELRVDEALTHIDVGEEPAEAISGLDIVFQPHAPAFHELAVQRGGFRPHGLGIHNPPVVVSPPDFWRIHARIPYEASVSQLHRVAIDDVTDERFARQRLPAAQQPCDGSRNLKKAANEASALGQRQGG